MFVEPTTRLTSSHRTAAAFRYSVAGTLQAIPSVIPVGLLYSALLLWPEFAANPSFQPVRTGIHQPVALQLTLVELFTLVIVLFPAVVGRGRLAEARLPAGLAMALIIGALVLVGSIWNGLNHGSHAHFGDWKALALGLGLWCSLTRGACRTRAGRSALAAVFISVTGAWAVWLLVAFVFRGGVVVPVLGTISVWDHPTLEFMTACSVLCSWLLFNQSASYSTRLLWYVGTAAPGLVVLLSFRRFAWIELIFGTILVILLSGRNAGSKSHALGWATIALSCLMLAVVLGPSEQSFGRRLTSIYTTGSTAKGGSYAGTNQSHLNDIRDAWDVVRRKPILGLGTGATYVGERTTRWKDVSGMVHNGPLDVWIKFGIAGLLLYIFGMSTIFIRTFNQIRLDPYAGGVLAFLLAQCVITTTVFTWPFDTLAGSVLFFTLVGLVHPSLRQAPGAC